MVEGKYTPFILEFFSELADENELIIRHAVGGCSNLRTDLHQHIPQVRILGYRYKGVALKISFNLLVDLIGESGLAQACTPNDGQSPDLLRGLLLSLWHQAADDLIPGSVEPDELLGLLP